MNMLAHSAETVALGWTLVHFCWQGAVIALLYALVDRCLARATAATRYAVAMAMLCLMPVAAVVTFVAQERQAIRAEQSRQDVASSRAEDFHVVVMKDAPLAQATATGELFLDRSADRLMPLMPRLISRLVPLIPWIDAAWLAGVLLLALRSAGGWWRLRTLRLKAQTAVPPAVQESFSKVMARLRLTHSVVLRVSNEVISPMAMGVWRTTVILPLSAALSLPSEQLEAVLAHELAHIRRWDYLCNLMQTAMECLFFFHPAVWWMSRRTRELREVCCDEVAARSCAEPEVYAEALLHVARQLVEPMPLATALHGSGGTLLRRIQRVLGEQTMEERSMSWVRIAVAGLVVAGLVAVPHFAKGQDAKQYPKPILEVSTVKPSSPDSANSALEESRGRSHIVNGFPVTFLIKVAYSVTNNQIVGGPEWIAHNRYDVQAQAIEGVKLSEDAGATLELLKEVLADRFKLKFHREQRMLPVYLLTVAKGGPKLKAADHKSTNVIYNTTANQIECRNPSTSVFGFVELLNLVHSFDRPVVDKTGITGEYDFDLKWATDESNTEVPMIFTAFQEQLGLKLESGKAMVEVMVIDHIEPPSPN